MFIRELEIRNFRVFSATEDQPFILDGFKIPNGQAGSGLNVFLGNNGTGKTSILDAIALCLTEYRGDSIEIADFNDPTQPLIVKAFAEKEFAYQGVMPRSCYKGKGFLFEAHVRSKNTAYLASSVVHDLLVIKAREGDKHDNDSVDLRVSVRNPWRGNRFSEINLSYIEKNRPYAIKTGMFNDTKFDRIMEDLNRQVLQQEKSTVGIDNEFEQLKSDLNSNILINSIQRFHKATDISVSLKIIDPFCPFDKAFLAHVTDKGIHLPLNKMGSGFEMIFSLLYSLSAIQATNKEIVVLIDEPELHLHPKLQEQFVKIILELSKRAQIILTTHSPLLLKQLFRYCPVNAKVLKKAQGNIQCNNVKEIVLPYTSADEINYLAFDIPSEEYFNELYGWLFERLNCKELPDFDKILCHNYQIPKDQKWTSMRSGKPRDMQCSLCTYIRNFIHHPENKHNEQYSVEQLATAIQQIRNILSQLKASPPKHPVDIFI